MTLLQAMLPFPVCKYERNKGGKKHVLYVNSCLITTLQHCSIVEIPNTVPHLFRTVACSFPSISRRIPILSLLNSDMWALKMMGCKTKPRCQGVVFNTKAEVDYTYVQVLFEDDYDIHIYIYIYLTVIQYIQEAYLSYHQSPP